MFKTKENIFANKNINHFVSQFDETVRDACEKFWEHNARLTITALSDFKDIREEIIISETDFFTSQIKVENHKPILIRLSRDFVEGMLNATLKSEKFFFKFSDLTPLEIKILNGFCEFIHKRLKDILIPVKDAKLSEKSEKNINILFTIEPKDELCSKIILSIPQDRIRLEQLKRIPAFKDEDFLTSSTFVKIKAGSSKITFNELQNLAQDDIIVLENSKLSELSLISGEVEHKFKTKINSSLILNLDNDEDDENEETMQIYEEVTMEKNLWDDIQIEINAEFEKVKMTIGELKQITQGQIVDLGSIFDNEISLFVENKKVAKGELIIINDRYAVRLNEILNSSAKNQTPNTIEVKPQPKPQPQPQTKPQPQAQPQAKPQPQAQAKAQVPPQNENEEFDYSDFEK